MAHFSSNKNICRGNETHVAQTRTSIQYTFELKIELYFLNITIVKRSFQHIYHMYVCMYN